MVLFGDEYHDFAIWLPVTGEKSVQYIIIDLAAKVGLGYDWPKSFSQTLRGGRWARFNLSAIAMLIVISNQSLLRPVIFCYAAADFRVARLSGGRSSFRVGSECALDHSHSSGRDTRPALTGWLSIQCEISAASELTARS